MRNRGQNTQGTEKVGEHEIRVPTPSASYRRRAWLEFQRALDPLAPLKPLARPKPRERLVAAEQLQAFVEAGRDLRAGHGDADRLERLPRLQTEAVAELLQRGLDLLGGERLDSAERLGRGGEDVRVEQRRVGLDVVEEEACKVGELAQLRDLLLHERHGRTHPLLVPVVTLLAQVLQQALGVLLGGQRAQVDAVHPVELGVVEGGRALADPLEREPLDQLVPRHDRRLAVGRPAEQREEVHQRRRDVAGCAELVHRDGAVPLRELLAVLAEDVRDVRVGRNLGAQSLQDQDLLRGVRDVVVAADHVRDPVEPVLDR